MQVYGHNEMMTGLATRNRTWKWKWNRACPPEVVGAIRFTYRPTARSPSSHNTAASTKSHQEFPGPRSSTLAARRA